MSLCQVDISGGEQAHCCPGDELEPVDYAILEVLQRSKCFTPRRYSTWKEWSLIMDCKHAATATTVSVTLIEILWLPLILISIRER